ncbi:MAG: 4Fe-4S binding protein [Candidatus Krumholzibacteria bacterium]|jgi:dihydroorotate dehydrogenase subfamily 1|nr:4Fe-4S binding protein [Candidatus Krumholzibacteria bacterium]MDP6668624.1 4Fe-4S binding protein [Candidatus Krumholzibacteria bacterium]MDP6798176.1 4Fe-4S binding protein [Candidatus Krumholzibacteria bacterium]MDP7022314.1 4Fe-4S binding protein [Candidatus Krumholzibacteria bacterium]
MADLTLSLFGLDFRNPLWPAAGPNVRDGEMCRRQARAGAGALVCKTISSEAAPVPKFHMMNLAKNRRGGMLNSELWSELPPEQWLEKEYAIALEGGVPVIASLGYTAEEVVRLGKLAEKAGVDALEVTVHYAKEEPWQVMKALREAVSLPIIAKISPHDPATVIDTARKMEPFVDAIAAINSLGPALRIDIENAGRVLGTELGYGWLTGPPIKPVALRIVFDLARTVKVPIIGVGGIRTGRDVVEFLMAGASAVQVCTQNIYEGPKLWKRLEKELSTWLDDHDYETARELTGIYPRKIAESAPELVEGVGTSGHVPMEGPPPTVIPEKCTLCNICVDSCEYDALLVDKEKNPDAVIVFEDRCFVCGLCVTVCPTAALDIPLDEELGPSGAIRP